MPQKFKRKFVPRIEAESTQEKCLKNSCFNCNMFDNRNGQCPYNDMHMKHIKENRKG